VAKVADACGKQSNTSARSVALRREGDAMTDAVDFDVVVVGAGAAGLAAALEAEEAGCSVLVVDSQGGPGGSSVLSGGIIMAAGTSIQRAAGIEDSAEQLFRDYLLFNQYKVEPALARALAYGSAPAVEWLMELGVEYHDQLMFAAEERAPRSHVPKMMGFGVCDVLNSTAKQRKGIEFAFGRRVNRLLSDGTRVTGVAVDDDELRAGAVIIATGGFGANPAMWAEHLPSIAGAGSSVWYIGAPGSQGDALGLAAQIGAQVTGHDRALVLATPDFFSNLEVYFPGWLMMVGRGGGRCVDESASYAVMEIANKRNGPLFAILDDEAKRAAQPNLPPQYKQSIPGTEGLALPSNWTEPNIDEMVTKGKVKRASTLAELARLLGVSAKGFVASVERYNRYVDEGHDPEYFKDAKFLRKVATPPFYGAELRLGILCLTSKGLRIDASAHVLDHGDEPIRGLFAAGECTGGVLGDVYMGSGNSYANCVVFGRIAGQTVGREARSLAATAN
jgi:fumarate reductase flavoprotein subunit